MKKIILTFKASLFILILHTSVYAVDKPSDSVALSQVSKGKVVWDITVGQPSKLFTVLKVIEETYEDLVRQKVAPDMIFTFRGPALRLISSEPLDFPLDEEETHAKLISLLSSLSQKPGVKMESCSIAARLLSVDNDTIISAVKPVGNTFVSLIGYQAKGYALIPIY